MADDSGGGGGIFGGGGIIGILVFLWFTGALDGFLGNDKKKDDLKKEVDQQIAEVETKIEVKKEELKKEEKDSKGVWPFTPLVKNDPQPVAGPQDQKPSRRWVTVLRDSNGTITRKVMSPARPRVTTFKGRIIINGNFVSDGEHFKSIMVSAGETYTFKRE